MGKTINTMPTGELQGKLVVGQMIIDSIKDNADPKALAAVGRLESQMKQIEQELQRRLEGKPEPQVVGLKSLTLKAQKGH